MATPKRFVNRKAAACVPRFSLGDRVRIRHFSVQAGRVVELRGPLGPGGAQVYRVRLGRKPKPTYIEVLEDQLELVSSAVLKSAKEA